jgi:hypothetical protein
MAEGVHDGLAGEIRWRDDGSHAVVSDESAPDFLEKIQKYA